MKKYYWTLLLTLFFSSTHGQNYNPLIRPNLIWDVMHGSGATCNLIGGNRYFFQGNITISGYQYNTIRTYPIIPVNPGPYCPPFVVDPSLNWITGIFIREDTLAKKVFVYNNDQDELFYDFNLSAGDTLNSQYAGQGSTLIIDSTGTTTLLNGAVRKIFFLNNGENYIESVGGSQGLQFPIVKGIGFWEIPICMTENNVPLWGDECFGFVGINIPDKIGSVKVLPNPSKNFININSDNNHSSIFTLFDLTGKIKMTLTFSDKTKTIDISGLAAGIYVYHVTNEERKVEGKLIVSD